MRAPRKALFVALILLVAFLQSPLAIIPHVKADSGEWQVDYSSDDCARYNGTLNLIFANTPYWSHPTLTMQAGMRWLNITIPQGSTIETAFIRWRAASSVAEPDNRSVNISGHDIDNSLTFSTLEDFDLRSRTDAIVVYELPATTSTEWYDTNDLSSIIQEIVDRGGWSSGNNLTLFTGPKDPIPEAVRAHSFDSGDGSHAAKLNITWSAPPEDAIENEGIVASDSTVDDEQWFFLNASIEVLQNSSTFLFNRIDIDPAGLNMSCSYTNSTGFVEENDPNNYLQLDVAVSVKTDLNNTFVRVDYYLRIHSNVTKDGVYNVTVYSTASGDLSDSDNYTSVFTLTIRTPSAPTLLFGAGFNATAPYVELHWTNNLELVTLFEVQNSSNNADWDYLGQNTTTIYIDSQVVNGTKRYYKVRACRDTGVGWKNSTFTDSNFETVYFIPGGEPGADYYYLGQVIDDYENEDYVSVKDQVLRNSTLDCMELNYTSWGGEGDYTGEHWDTAGFGSDNPMGITTDGINIYIGDYTDIRVYKLDMDGGIITSWSVSTQVVFLTDITTDGSNIWIVCKTNDRVYKYTMAGSFVSSFDISSESTYPEGITTDGNFIWISDTLSAQDAVYKYSMDGTYQDETWSTITAGPEGLETDGTNIWLMDVSEEVRKFDMSGNYVFSWFTTDETVWPRSLTTNGTYFWVVDNNLDEVFIYEFGAGGYADSGYFTTTEMLSGINGTSLVLLTNTTIPGSDSITVEFSEDNSTWLNHNGGAGSDTIIAGNETIDLRDLEFATLYLRYNFTDGGDDSTPRLYQTRLISTEGDVPENGVAINYPGIIVISFNTTIAEAGCEVYGDFSDAEGLSGYIFWNNATFAPGGVNSSFTALTGISNSTLEAVTLPVSGAHFGVKYYVNDTDGNWGVDTLAMFPAAAEEEGDTIIMGAAGVFWIILIIIVPIVGYVLKKG